MQKAAGSRCDDLFVLEFTFFLKSVLGKGSITEPELRHFGKNFGAVSYIFGAYAEGKKLGETLITG